MSEERLGWRVVRVVQIGEKFRAYASYRDPAARRVRGTPGPTYQLADNGLTAEEAVSTLLKGCMLDKKWPELLNEVAA